jgi:hypothetical protein
MSSHAYKLLGGVPDASICFLIKGGDSSPGKNVQTSRKRGCGESQPTEGYCG